MLVEKTENELKEAVDDPCFKNILIFKNKQ